jgi:guanylate kinase
MSRGGDHKTEYTKNPASGKKGILFILSAPSGAGKTTLCKKLLRRFSEIRFSISHTTRPPRPDETEGVDYFFITREKFLAGIENSTWAEWAEVHGNYYGTSMSFLNQSLSSGIHVLLDIDIQGARQILQKYPDAITVFIMPPSIEILRSRLRKRGTESEDMIEQRIMNAKQEIQSKDLYRYIIVNDNLEDSTEALCRIVKEHLKRD